MFLKNNKDLLKNNKKILTFNKMSSIIQNKGYTIHFFGRKYMKNKLTIFTKAMLDFMYYSGMIVTVCVPWIYKLMMPYKEEIRQNYIILSVILIICGILAVLIIGELRKIFKTVINEDCFVMENVNCLKKMGTYSFLIAAMMVIRFFCYLNMAVIVVLIVFIVAGLFSKVLAQVFDTAVNYKLENDLTI